MSYPSGTANEASIGISDSSGKQTRQQLRVPQSTGIPVFEPVVNITDGAGNIIDPRTPNPVITFDYGASGWAPPIPDNLIWSSNGAQGYG
jgi:hypothetical protein